MIKHILSFALLVFLSTILHAQCIPVDTTDVPGYYPSQLSHAYSNEPYSDTLNVLVIPDTTVIFSGVPANVRIDSAILRNVVNLPPSFSFECHNPRCVYTPKKMGCAVVNGNPTEADEGVDTVGLVITMYGKAFGTIAVNQTDTLWRFVLDIRNKAAYLKEIVEPTIRIYPNPVSSGLRAFQYTGPNWESLTIYDGLGRKVSFNHEGQKVTLLNTKSGLYHVNAKLENGGLYQDKLLLY